MTTRQHPPMIEPAYICAKLAQVIRRHALHGITEEPLGSALHDLAFHHPSWLMMDEEERARIPFMACDQLHTLLPAIGLSAELDALIAFREAWDGTQGLAVGPIPQSTVDYNAPAYRAGNEVRACVAGGVGRCLDADRSSARQTHPNAYAESVVADNI